MQNIALTLGFDEQRDAKAQWYVYRVSNPKPESRDVFLKYGMQPYLPLQKKEVKMKNGSTKTEFKPKIFKYVFVLANLAQIKKLRADMKIMPMLIRRSPEDEIRRISKYYYKVPFDQMHMLMSVLECDGEVEIVQSDDMKLEKGDKVFVSDGAFKGAEGVLVTSQGSKSGRVFVALSSYEGVLTASIPEQYLKIVEFSRNNDHFYKKVEAFERVLDKAFETYREKQLLDEKQRGKLAGFISKYAYLRNLTHANHAKLVACRYAAYSLLGKTEKARECIEDFEESILRDKRKQLAEKRSPSSRQNLDKWIERVKNELKLR